MANSGKGVRIPMRTRGRQRRHKPRLCRCCGREMEPTQIWICASCEAAGRTVPRARGVQSGAELLAIARAREAAEEPILEGWGLEGSEVPLEEVLHLKTGVNYIENNNMLVSGEFIDKPDFAQYNKIVVPEEEAYGANCIWVNDTVIVAEGYPTVLKAVQDLGYKTLVVDTSEYRKVDGGLSCLSLRF